MLMSSKRNIKKEMFQPTTECVDSLTIDDVTGQAVPESGTGRKELSVSVLSVWHSYDVWMVFWLLCIASSLRRLFETRRRRR